VARSGCRTSPTRTIAATAAAISWGMPTPTTASLVPPG
jgi:hypothetical protein